MASEQMSGGGEVEPGKLFVGGLSWTTSKDSLEQHFTKYGELDDCTVMTDNVGNPRGFGFVKFKNPDHAKIALGSGEQVLDGKKIDPKPATKNNPQNPLPKVKVFVGGLSQQTTHEDLRSAFSRFGTIAMTPNAVEIKMDPNTGKPRGFGFVTFERAEEAKAAVDQKWVQVNEKQVEVKTAENPKPKGYRNGPGVYGGGAPSGGVYNGFGGQSYQQDHRQMAQQPSSYNYPQAYPPQSYQQYPPNASYGQAGYNSSSGAYPVYGQGTSAHGQAMNNYDGYNGYGASREAGYPQQYNYSTQQPSYPAGQASHTGYSRSQQGYSNGYPVRQ